MHEKTLKKGMVPERDQLRPGDKVEWQNMRCTVAAVEGRMLRLSPPKDRDGGFPYLVDRDAVVPVTGE